METFVELNIFVCQVNDEKCDIIQKRNPGYNNLILFFIATAYKNIVYM